MALAIQLDGVGVAGVGDFGEAVRDRFVRHLGAAPVTVEELTAAELTAEKLTAEELTAEELTAEEPTAAGPLPGAPEVLVVALWRPLEELCERVDEAAFAAGRPWLPVVFEHPWVVVGPWLAPPDGPCHRCYLDRRAQHRQHSDTVQALTEAYAADPELGVSGHLPHHVRLAVGLAQQALRLREPGLVLSANTVGSRISAHRTVGCHGCPRCGQQDRLGVDGAVARVARSLRTPALARTGSAR
ncbi:TOMM precursor leader peptide-binding protein [Kitasatospora sp. NBC_01287]|uniref:TOMM precursor leader peptide-binding protein n=1 Tax=Kitasatospora sp. NBC_01287 TaxID=2903573 RepID=UPI0022585A6F|nr:TOMM precursor leader peptide-binding protein [Kitasatospora sp. NBC_01287]MCX4748198.1 TOMM precursor leader peptide-binding protein [Kitasatospora sp. NBC_01287]